MRRRRRPLPPSLLSALLGLALAASLAGCGGDPEPGGPGGPGGPAAGGAGPPSATVAQTAPLSAAAPVAAPAPPSVGACYRLSFEEAVAPSSTELPLPCAKPHTSQTFAVGRLRLVADGHLLGVDADRVRRQVARRCSTRLGAFLGASPRTLRLSLLRPVWFTPTPDQAAAGTGWYRCDVIAVTDDASLAKVSGGLEGALARPTGRAAYAMCGTAAPGDPGFSHVLCRDPHAWRAISVVDLASLARRNGGYPGGRVVRRAGEDGACADAAREVVEDTLDFQWGYEWPTLEQWRTGQTYGRCWAPG